MLCVPAETVRILNEKEWEKWQRLKDARFEMKYNPRKNLSGYDGKFFKYQDLKSWQKLLGKNSGFDSEFMHHNHET
jgi:hypothetical protein